MSFIPVIFLMCLYRINAVQIPSCRWFTNGESFTRIHLWCDRLHLVNLWLKYYKLRQCTMKHHQTIYNNIMILLIFMFSGYIRLSLVYRYDRKYRRRILAFCRPYFHKLNICLPYDIFFGQCSIMPLRVFRLVYISFWFIAMSVITLK